ncbi:hypothetical protein PoB_004827500 [Plakobranchus ocellatus]|uniref:Uncharacterized protein n=1 Tax=Plakobranchus ocellatus TaxID=259542 RepID=A0AAV4BR73_9GAST|nr:hypothetical protein PoB_004827500 [Plakobranchus ocellatus]
MIKKLSQWVRQRRRSSTTSVGPGIHTHWVTLTVHRRRQHSTTAPQGKESAMVLIELLKRLNTTLKNLKENKGREAMLAAAVSEPENYCLVCLKLPDFFTQFELLQSWDVGLLEGARFLSTSVYTTYRA